MIEFSQPAQCLFCPQRRKIALLMKLVLAGSAATITAIILFQPVNTRVPATRNVPSFQGITANSPGVQPRTDGQAIERSGASDAVLKRGAEIRAEAEARFKEVQSQIRPLLKEELPPLAKAQKLLNELGREVLKTKVLTLGEELFSGSGAAEAERKLVLEALDKEMSVLVEQKALLTQLNGSN
jgi:hypothetical protein